MTDLVLQTGWMNPENRRRMAVQAVSERDLRALDSLMNTYLDLWGRRRAATATKTRLVYRRGVAKFFNTVWPEGSEPDPHPLRLTPDDVARYIALLQGDLQPASVQTYVAALRSLYSALTWAEAVKRNPFEGISVPGDRTPSNIKHPPVPSRLYDEMVRALIDREDAVSRRDLVVVLLFGDAGYRIGDVVACNVSDIDLENAVGIIRKGKGGKAAEQPLSDTTLHAVYSYLGIRDAYAHKGERGLLVNFGDKVNRRYHGQRTGEGGVRGILKRRYLAAGVPERFQKSHALRKRAVTDVYEATGDMKTAQDFGRHTDPGTTIRYIGDSSKRIRGAVDKVEALRRARLEEQRLQTRERQQKEKR